jgi:hypothetical protein
MLYTMQDCVGLSITKKIFIKKKYLKYKFKLKEIINIALSIYNMTI